MSVDEKVRAHFDADAIRFDAIYSTEKGPFAKFVDGVWRGVVKKRLDMNLQLLAPIRGKHILDVGCGSGRFCIAYALQGASHVVGVDLAPLMIRLADDAARGQGLTHLCEFRVGSFTEVVTNETFDASTANGFFDYVENPVPILKRMREVTRGTMIMSFPKKFEWRIPVRWVRFQLNGCPLYLYTRRKVFDTLAQGGVSDFECIDLGRDYLIVARV
jgi:2-polyprenyl-3-methyl-5-hydroxy-6-metoxy-1,4-benzoquinol methylase